MSCSPIKGFHLQNLKNSLQDETSTNKQIRKDLKNAKIELATIKKDVLQTNKNNITSFKKYFFVNRKASTLCDLWPRYSTLSEEVVTISDIKLGEGTFGVVYKGFYSPLNVNCAIKVGKSDKYFDVYLEAQTLQLLQSSRYFPRLFGIFSNKLALEYVHSGQKVKTLLSVKKESSLSNELYNRIFYQLADAVKFMHKSNLLHNDIKTNNVLLKGESLQPILIDMGISHIKAWSSCIQLYWISEKQIQSEIFLPCLWTEKSLWVENFDGRWYFFIRFHFSIYF